LFSDWHQLCSGTFSKSTHQAADFEDMCDIKKAMG
jgi:hypothetical protein